MRRKSIKRTILEHFFVSPSDRLRVRQIEKTLKLPLPSVIRYSKELEREGILKKVKISNVVFYTSDRSSQDFILEKRLYNIKQLYASGLIEFLKKEFSNPAVVLFGSYAMGEDIENSDIDLYVETPSKKEIRLDKYERILKRRIQLFVHASLDEIKNRQLMNNIVNGTILNGFIEVFR